MKTIDLSHLKTTAGVARAVYRALQKEAENLGQDPDLELHLRKPSDTGLIMDEYCHGQWHIAWEGGPYEWAYSLGDGIFTGEGYGPCGPRFVLPRHVYTEPARSFVLVFVEA